MFGISNKSDSIRFCEKHNYEKRKNESSRMRVKYPERVPVIIEKAFNDTYLDSLDKIKYLVPCDLTVGQLMYVVRRRLKLEPEKALFFLVNETMPAATALVSAIYKDQKDADGFLYITYSSESTFG